MPHSSRARSHERSLVTSASRKLVGTGRFELPTCRLGGDRHHYSHRAQRLRLCAPTRSLVSSASRNLVGTGRFELPTCRLGGDRHHYSHRAQRLRLCAPTRSLVSSASRNLVGTGRFELPTCRLGGDRSIHLSYVPESTFRFYQPVRWPTAPRSALSNTDSRILPRHKTN